MSAAILITGGTQRLGLAMAEALLAQGETVIITYRTHKLQVDILASQGARMIQCDFAIADDIKRLCQLIDAEYESLRAIIHNASDWDQEATSDDYSQLMQKMMQVHAQAPYEINLALQEKLLAFDGVADIIHMTDYVQGTGSKKHIAYAASKAALHNLTLSFATLLAPNVKVNSIAPALLMFNDHDSDAYKAKSLQKSLLQICPGAQEAVKAMNFLFDSDFVTGQTMHLDGGRHLK